MTDEFDKQRILLVCLAHDKDIPVFRASVVFTIKSKNKSLTERKYSEYEPKGIEIIQYSTGILKCVISAFIFK